MSPPTIDAFFVTHHHFDHVGGLHELNHAAMGFDAHVGIEGGSLAPDSFSDSEKPSDPEFAVYLTQTALEHVEDANPHLTNSIDFRTVDHDTIVEIGEMRVVPFPVRHGRPQFDTLGFAVYHDDSKVVYAPDMWEFMGGTEYRGADLLFAESSALFRAFGHGKESDLRSALRDAKAERTVLINLNEHLQRMTTSELRNSVREMDVADELGEDFATYNL